jgi:hypothetical protein
MASALKEPFGAPATLRTAPIEDLMPPGEFRLVGVSKMLGDNAPKIRIDHGPVGRERQYRLSAAALLRGQALRHQ